LARLVKHLVPYHIPVRYDTEREGGWRFESVVRPLIDHCAAVLVVGSADGSAAPAARHDRVDTSLEWNGGTVEGYRVPGYAKVFRAVSILIGVSVLVCLAIQAWPR
jgi:hypothetical protein